MRSILWNRCMKCGRSGCLLGWLQDKISRGLHFGCLNRVGMVAGKFEWKPVPKWSSPPIRCLKLNGDGGHGTSRGKLRLFRISRMLHDHNNSVLNFFTRPMGTKDSDKAEFFAVGEGFRIFSYLQNIIVEPHYWGKLLNSVGWLKLYGQSCGL